MPSWTGAGGSTWRSIPARPRLKKSAWWGGATTFPSTTRRRAILRIGVALVLLWDISCSYLPNYDVFYGDGSLGAPRLMHDAGRSPAWAWSILRGVGDPLTSHLALVVLLVTSTLILMGLWS